MGSRPAQTTGIEILGLGLVGAIAVGAALVA